MSIYIEIIIEDIHSLLEKEKKSFDDIADEMYEHFYVYVPYKGDLFISGTQSHMTVSFHFEEEERYPELAKSAVETVLVVFQNSPDVKVKNTSKDEHLCISNTDFYFKKAVEKLKEKLLHEMMSASQGKISPQEAKDMIDSIQNKCL